VVARTYSSNNKVLKFALEDVYIQQQKDFFISNFDFAIFAIHPKYPHKDINSSIKKIFKTDNFVAFNAVDAFCNSSIVKGLTVLFIKFENKGKIDVFCCKDIDNKASSKKFYQYIRDNQDDLHIIISNSSEKMPFFLEDINAKFQQSNTKLNLIGGMSSGEIVDDELLTYQYYKDDIIKNGFVVISFKNVEFKKGVSLGYQPIGPVYKVNMAIGNKVYVVEYDDASLIAKRLLSNIDSNNIQYLWYSPMVILDDEEGEVEVVRTFKTFKEQEYVEFFGPIRDNSYVKLSFATSC